MWTAVNPAPGDTGKAVLTEREKDFEKRLSQATLFDAKAVAEDYQSNYLKGKPSAWCSDCTDPELLAPFKPHPFLVVWPPGRVLVLSLGNGNNRWLALMKQSWAFFISNFNGMFPFRFEARF